MVWTKAAPSFTKLLWVVYGVVCLVAAVEPRSIPGSFRCHCLAVPNHLHLLHNTVDLTLVPIIDAITVAPGTDICVQLRIA